MDEKQQFFKLLRLAKRKLLFKQLSKHIHWGFVVFGLTIILLLLLARMVVITYLVEKIVILAVLVLLGIILITIIKRPSNKQAALYFDNFIEEDHVITALQYMDDTTIMSQLQRRDSLSKMKQVTPKVQSDNLKKLNWKLLLATLVLAGVSLTLYYLPNGTMKLAKEKEIEQELVQETKEEIQKLAEEDDKEILKELEEEAKDLKESNELLEKLLKEEAKLANEKQAAEESESQLKELAKEMDGFFDEISKALEEADAEKLNKAIENLLEDQLASLSPEQQQALENLLAQVLNQGTPNLSELTEEQINEMIAALEGQLNELVASANSLQELIALQQSIQDLATSLQENMINNGISESNRLAFGDPKKTDQQNGDSSNFGQNGNNDTNGQPPSQGNANGNGNGEGNGNGTGNSNGSGTGNGNGGSGNGGSGSGAGFGQGSRELTIPEKIDGDGNIVDDFGEMGEGNSDFQTTPDGIVLKGTVRSYDQVYGKYRDSFRKSVERLGLPTYLENVVKDYFTDLEPGGE